SYLPITPLSHALIFFFFTLPRPPTSTLFPYTTLFRYRLHSPLNASMSDVAGVIGYHAPTVAPAYRQPNAAAVFPSISTWSRVARSEEHTSELQSRGHLVCRPLLEKKKLAAARSADTAY